MSGMYPKLPPGYITKSTAIILSSSTLLYGFVEYITGNEAFQRKQLMPLMHYILGPERTTRLNVYLAKYRLLPPFSQSYREYPELACSTMGMHFTNPLGLAAGFDRDAEAINGLRKSGFGFIEVGTVTPLLQKRDRKTTVKRLAEDEGYISDGKFQSAGLGTVHLFVKKAYDRNTSVPLGVNIGRNTEFDRLRSDYSIAVDYFGPFSDYVVVNFGGPNDLERISDLETALQSVTSAVRRMIQANEPHPKILIKISPDLSASDLKAIALNKRYVINGIIVSNSTTHRLENLQAKLSENGLLSGKPLRDISTECIRNIYRLTSGKVPIIGCGGISSGQDAYEKIRAGASLVQLYSSLLYQGFPVIGRIKRELLDCLTRDGFQNISEAVGIDHKIKK